MHAHLSQTAVKHAEAAQQRGGDEGRGWALGLVRTPLPLPCLHRSGPRPLPTLPSPCNSHSVGAPPPVRPTSRRNPSPPTATCQAANCAAVFSVIAVLAPCSSAVV